MTHAQDVLREAIRRNGGRRGFPKSGDGLMLAILADMAKRGELVRGGETDAEIVYCLPDAPPDAPSE